MFKQILAAAGILTIAGSAQAATILMTGNSQDTDYTNFLTGLGHSVTFKANGNSAEQISGDLDNSRVIGGVNQPLRSYINTFDAVIVLRTSNSGNFTAPTDWAEVTPKILVHNAFVARGSRMGFWGGDSGTFDLNVGLLPTAETAIPLALQGSPLFTGVTITSNAADLLDGTEFDGLQEPNVMGIAGTVYGRSNGTFSGSTYANLIYLQTGTTIYNGNSLSSTSTASERLFFGAPDAEGFAGLTGGGERVIQNFLVPEPTTVALLGIAGMLIGRRRR